MERPQVGIGVIIENEGGKILIGKRKGSHAPYYSIPGGHLEAGESFEEAAMKEVAEETGLLIHSPRVIAVTNNLRTWRDEGRHYISIILHTNRFEGSPRVMEKDKCEGWEWMHPGKVPEPHFDASAFGIDCYLHGRFYIPGQK